MSRKMIALLLAALLIFSLAACQKDGGSKATGKPQPDPTKTSYDIGPPAETSPWVTAVPSEGEPSKTYIAEFSLTYSADGKSKTELFMCEDMSEGARLEFKTSATHKSGTLDFIALRELDALLEESSLLEMTDAEAKGEGSAVFYLLYSDETEIAFTLKGQLSEDFLDDADKLTAFFTAQSSEMPEVLPDPKVTGSPEPVLENAVMDLLKASGIKALDAFTITAPNPKNDSFSAQLGIQEKAGAAAGVLCYDQSLGITYKVVIIRAEKAGSMAALREDMIANITWDLWTETPATHALVAEKNTMLLLLIGEGDAFTATAASLEKAGWKNISTYTAP